MPLARKTGLRQSWPSFNTRSTCSRLQKGAPSTLEEDSQCTGLKPWPKPYLLPAFQRGKDSPSEWDHQIDITDLLEISRKKKSIFKTWKILKDLEKLRAREGKSLPGIMLKTMEANSDSLTSSISKIANRPPKNPLPKNNITSVSTLKFPLKIFWWRGLIKALECMKNSHRAQISTNGKLVPSKIPSRHPIMPRGFRQFWARIRDLGMIHLIAGLRLPLAKVPFQE